MDDPKFEVACVVRGRMIRADERYGPFASSHEALGVASEEWDEFRAAIQSNDLDSAANEALDLAAVLLRFASAVQDRQPELIARSVK